MLQTPRSFMFTRAPPTAHNKYANDRKARPAAKQEKDMSSTITTEESRPTTPSSPVIIPLRGGREPSHGNQRTFQSRKDRSKTERTPSERSERRARTIHSPDALPPSVAALLAITAIPRQKTSASIGRRSGAGQRLTVDAILAHTQEEYRTSLGKTALDVLLSPPDYSDDEDNDIGRASVMSTRTMSSESMPSLDNESISEASFSSVITPSPRSRRSLRSRNSDGSTAHHPLADINIDELDFRVFEAPQTKEKENVAQSLTQLDSSHRKSAFKSNLTASLKALRSAAKSISSLAAAPLILPDDFLTRSIITIDPRVPFTDERMPPRLEDTPTPALRRYLNPTTNAPIEAHVPSRGSQSSSPCTASIQMQTYKVSRSGKSTSPSVISRRTQSTSEEAIAEVVAGPVARQRECRENGDFIRVAVLEMAMRRKGKLDSEKPGRARWALPARKPPTKPYQISDNGVPVRWIAVTH